MFSFLLNIIIIMAAMWWFFRYMYPKPPKEFFAKEDDDTSLRTCDHCGHQLATYRGILIPKTLPPSTPESEIVHTFQKDDKHVIQDECYFFCNAEHQNLFSHQSNS